MPDIGGCLFQLQKTLWTRKKVKPGRIVSTGPGSGFEITNFLLHKYAIAQTIIVKDPDN